MDRNLRIRMLMEAADRVSRPLRDIMGGSRKAAEALRGTRQELQRIEDAQEQLRSFRTLRDGMRGSATAMNEARQRAAALERQIEQTANPTKKLQRDFAAATRTADQLAASHRKDADQLRDLRTQLQAAGASTRDLSRYERQLADSAADANRRLGEQSTALERAENRRQRFGQARDRFDRTMGTGRNIAGAGLAASGTAVAVAAPLVASGRVAMDLEEGMAGVAKVTGMAETQLVRMRDSLVDLTTEIPMTAVELSNIAAAAGAAGVGVDKAGKALATQRQELVAFTGDAAKMGIAFDMAAEDAGGTMAKWRSAFKMTQPEVVALGDRINALTNRFGGNAAAVADIVTRIGPLGEVAGMGAPQIAALGHYMNRVGVESEIAATGIKNTLLALTKGSAATKSQQTAMKGLGLDAAKVAKAMQVDASGTIVDVLERIRRLSPDKQASVLNQMFGSESLGAIAPLLSNLDAVKTELGLVGDRSQYAGSMTEEFLSRISTTQGATDLALNGLQAVNLELGQALLPNIKAGARYVADVTGRLRTWAKANPGVAKGVLYVAAGVASLFALFAGGALIIAGLMAPFAALSFAATTLGIAVAPLLGTVALVVGGIALLAFGAYQLYQHWDTVAGYFGGIWSSIRNYFAQNWTFIRNLLLGATVVFMPPVAAIMLVASAIYRNWDRIRSACANGIAYLAGIVQPFVRPFLSILSLLAGLYGRFSQMGLNLIQGLGRGILSGVRWVLGLVTNVASTIGGAFAKAMGIRSPSRLFMGFGGYMMQGLHNGIDADADSPVNRITRLSRELAGAMALGTATPALAGGLSPPGGTGTSAGAMATAPMTVTIHINGADRAPGDIGREVEDALARIEARRRADSYSAFADRPDWNE